MQNKEIRTLKMNYKKRYLIITQSLDCDYIQEITLFYKTQHGYWYNRKKPFSHEILSKWVRFFQIWGAKQKVKGHKLQYTY